MALRSQHDPVRMLTRRAGERRQFHDDVTAVVVFLPGSRRALLAPGRGRGQRRIDGLLRTASAGAEAGEGGAAGTTPSSGVP